MEHGNSVVDIVTRIGLDSRVQMILCAMLHAALHIVSFVHGCFAEKCILTGSTEHRYECFKVDGSMEKKWDTVIPADLKRLLVTGTYMSRWSRKG